LIADMQVAGLTMIKRLALIIDNAPRHPCVLSGVSPDKNAGNVLAWLRQNRV